MPHCRSCENGYAAADVGAGDTRAHDAGAKHAHALGRSGLYRRIAHAGIFLQPLRHEKDGDTHGWLKLDPQFQNLLNPGNMSKEGGNLVFEIVCKFVPPTQPDAVSSCVNYTSNIAIPPVGSRVKIVGPYVRDTNHSQWMEIHPVTSIKVIQ